jgi:nucleoside-diphosphate-sugar epimerase
VASSTLIIGGAGFIGAYVARRLLAVGQAVSVYDRDVRHSPIVSLLTPDELARLTLLPGDVTDPIHLLRTVAEVRPTRLLHLAATLTPESQTDPATAVRVITLGATNILEAVRMFGVERLVWASSVQIFGPLDRYRARHAVEQIDDQALPDPISIYGACKAQAELLARHYAQTWGLDVTGLRPCGAIGPGRRGGATFEVIDMVQRVARGEPVTLERADWVFPLCYVDDVADAFVAVLTSSTPGDGQSLNVGAIPTTLRELGEMMRELEPDARIEVRGCETSPSAEITAPGIERLHGFRLRHDLIEALASLLAEARGRA